MNEEMNWGVTQEVHVQQEVRSQRETQFVEENLLAAKLSSQTLYTVIDSGKVSSLSGNRNHY